MEEVKKMRPREYIKVRGANEHNLKNVNVDIPRNELVVLTGMSGSGKSSLAFDTIYAEGQRRYMESLSSYARMFLGQMEKPNVERIDGLSPAISIDQKSTNRNPRSTVGTVTEIYDYFRLLYARIGIPHCPKCGREIARQSVDQMVDQIMVMDEGTKIQLLAPVVRGRKGEHEKVLDRAKRSGYVRVRIDGNLYELTEEIKLEKNIKHNIEIVVDRLVVKPGIERRLTDSIENVLGLADGLLMVDVIGGETLTFSQSFSCPDCGVSISEVEPRSFSFNNPFGACPDCLGLGYTMKFTKELILDEEKSFAEGCILAPGWINSNKKDSFGYAVNKALADRYHIDMTVPFKDLDPLFRQRFVYDGFPDSVPVHYKSQRGTGVYDFDDEDDRQEALQEATLKAKANLSKFLNETIAADEELESLSKKAKTLSKNGDVTMQAVTKESVKTTGLSIRNSSKTLLTGAITLESKRIPMNGDGGTYQVTIGVSSKTAAAAKEISNKMTDSLNDRRKVKGDGSNIGEGGNNGLDAASSPMSGSGTLGSPSTKKGPNANNTRETRKAKTVF